MKRLGPFTLLVFAVALSSFVLASESPPELGSERVEIVGKLHTGKLAIGGETTGILLSAKDGVHYELLVKDPKRAKRFDGREVRVTGKLNLAHGVEIPIRRIIEVATLEAE